MTFLQLTIEIGDADPQPVEDALFELGAVSVTLEDADDDPVLEPAPGETPLWPTITVKAVFDAAADGPRIARKLAGRLPLLPPPRLETLADREWEREWLKDFRPMQFGRRLWVCPGGLPAGDPEAVRIELDPGLAFGTGTHATTALCLEWLEGLDLERRSGVDYGCGSGILAIAAAMLGADSIRAVDIDPQALIATDANASRNGVRDRLQVTSDPALPHSSADFLVANILAGPLVANAGRFAAAIRPGGQIAISGILEEQSDAVTGAYRPWFDIASTARRDGWVLLDGRRRTD